jgi:hypothetical protein
LILPRLLAWFALLWHVLAAAQPLDFGPTKNVYSLANEVTPRIAAAQSVEEVSSLSAQFGQAIRERISHAAHHPSDVQRDSVMAFVADGASLLGKIAIEDGVPRSVRVALERYSWGMAGNVVVDLLVPNATSTPRYQLWSLLSIVNRAAEKRNEELLARDGLLERYRDFKRRAGSAGDILRSAIAARESKNPQLENSTSRAMSNAPVGNAPSTWHGCDVLKDSQRSAELLRESQEAWLALTERCTN